MVAFDLDSSNGYEVILGGGFLWVLHCLSSFTLDWLFALIKGRWKKTLMKLGRSSALLFEGMVMEDKKKKKGFLGEGMRGMQ